MGRPSVVFCLIALLVAPARAEQAKTYDLQECVRAALEDGPDLAAASADLDAARARLAQAEAGRLGDSSYTQYLGVVNEAQGDAVHSPNSKNEFFEGLGPFTRIDLNMRIPLWTFGKLDAALKAAQHGLASEEADAEQRRAEVVFRTRQLYYGYLFSRQLTDILREMFDTLEKAVKKTQERLDAGTSSVTELDLLKLKIGRAKFAKGVLEIEASSQLTRSALARAIGLPMDAAFEVAEQRLQPVSAQLSPLDDYLNGGVQHRPEWRQLENGTSAQEAKVKIEAAAYYPSLFLAAGVSYAKAGNRDEQDNPFVYDEFNYIRPYGIVGINWDLNFWSTKAKVAEARADLQRLRAQEHDAATGLELELRRAYSDVTQAEGTMKAAEQGRKAGRGLLILTVSNFDLGIGEAQELFDGLGGYTESSADYLRAVHDYNIAIGSLSKAVGREITELKY